MRNSFPEEIGRTGVNGIENIWICLKQTLLKAMKVSEILSYLEKIYISYARWSYMPNHWGGTFQALKTKGRERNVCKEINS